MIAPLPEWNAQGPFFWNQNCWYVEFSQLLPQPSPFHFRKVELSGGLPRLLSRGLTNNGTFLWELRYTCDVIKPVPIKPRVGWQPAHTSGPLFGPGRCSMTVWLGSANSPGLLEGKEESLRLTPSPGVPVWAAAESWGTQQGKEATDGEGQWQWPLTCFEAGRAHEQVIRTSAS